MSDRPVDLVLLNALRRFADEARRAAAVASAGSPEHDFYAGVQLAAQRRLEPGLAAGPPPDLERRAPAFRDGYIEASTLIGVAATTTAPLHLPLPRFSPSKG